MNGKRWYLSGLARGRKVLIVTLKFENMCIRKFDAHRILACIIFIDCWLKVWSTKQCWVVTAILDLSVTLWNLSNTLNKWDIKHRHPLVDKQVLSKNHWYCLVIPNITFPGKIRFWVNKNILTQISVTSNHMSLQKTFCVKFGQQVCKSAMEDLIRNKQPVKQLLQRRPIFIDHLPKFNTKNSVWSQFILNGTSGLMRAKLFFHIFLLRVLYQGSHALTSNLIESTVHCKPSYFCKFLKTLSFL